MENFRKPNFELVADILFWMVKLYDPDTNISDRVEFENERVDFLTGIATLLLNKARIKLNTKKLYASDGRAVQELLKLATLLYKATKSSSAPLKDEAIPPPIKIQDIKLSRSLASEITQSGAKLFDLLSSEITDRHERLRSLRFLDSTGSSAEGSREHAYIERCIREIIDSTKQAVEDMKKEAEEMESDEKNLELKIRKKQEELERTEKRLKSLENVRPQFMDDVERLEKELQRHYDVYLEKYRNLDYLEHELEKYNKHEEERKADHERKLKKMRERLLKEEVDLLRGGKKDDSDSPIKGGSASSNRASLDRTEMVRSQARAQAQSKSSAQDSDDEFGYNEPVARGAAASKGPSAHHRASGRGAGNVAADDDDEEEDDEEDEDDDDDDDSAF